MVVISVVPVDTVLLTLALAASAEPPVLSVACAVNVALVPTLPLKVKTLVFNPAGAAILAS